jgi:hypothetical protein
MLIGPDCSFDRAIGGAENLVTQSCVYLLQAVHSHTGLPHPGFQYRQDETGFFKDPTNQALQTSRGRRNTL